MRTKRTALVLSLGVILTFSAPTASAELTLETQAASPASQPRDRMISVTPPGSRMPMSITPSELRIPDSFRGQLEAKRAAAKSSIASKRTQLQTRIAQIQDSEKKVVVTRIESRLEATNMAVTDRYATALEEMNLFLDRASTKAAMLEAGGMDTMTVEASITRARTAITTAQTAVANQAGKTYTPTLTTDANIATNVGSSVSLLRQDLRVTYQSVINARQAVSSAVRALSLLEVAEMPTRPVEPNGASGSAR